MKTSTILLIAVAAYFLMQQRAQAAASAPPTVPVPQKPTEAINSGGSTFDKVMLAIAATAGVVKAGIDASQQRG